MVGRSPLVHIVYNNKILVNDRIWPSSYNAYGYNINAVQYYMLYFTVQYITAVLYSSVQTLVLIASLLALCSIISILSM